MRHTRFSQSFQLCWLALSLSPLLVEAATIGQSATESLEKRVVDGCEVPGNPDLYGLGVRLGEFSALFSFISP
jgi:hypothetical protein